MKKWIGIVAGLIFCLQLTAQDQLNVMTFNIRFNNPGDSLDAWPYRKEMVASQILFHQTHIAGLQEALHEQVIDLKNSLTRYKYVGVSRSAIKEKGEYTAIFYDTTFLQVLQSATFWLAEQTDVPGKKGWDAALERIVTWAKFKDRRTKKVFYFFNTHFDHVGIIAKKESALLLKQKVKDIAGNSPVIITGDFNARPGEDPIMILTDRNKIDSFTDAKEVSQLPHYGPTGTFNGFRSKETDDRPIDFIFIKNGVDVYKHATLSQTWRGHFSSDHFPVFISARLK